MRRRGLARAPEVLCPIVGWVEPVRSDVMMSTLANILRGTLLNPIQDRGSMPEGVEP